MLQQKICQFPGCHGIRGLCHAGFNGYFHPFPIPFFILENRHAQLNSIGKDAFLLPGLLNYFITGFRFLSNAFHADRVLDLTPATNATALLTFDVPADSAAAAVVFRLYLPCPCTGSSDADAPRAHVLSATLPATPGTVATTAFAPVPAGWHPAAAMPEGEPELRRTFWILAR